jgi:ubiquinone/menaquinone biosynthesis C-methylase UbiE
VLEIGYGAGFLAYSLAPGCGRYLGVDIHRFPAEVQAVLNRQGIGNVSLSVGDARRLDGLESESVDLVVSVSCIEHIRELDQVQTEVFRVLKRGGAAVFGMPAKNFLTRLLFKAVGYDDWLIHPSTTRDCLASASAAGLALEEQHYFPRGMGDVLGLYWVARFRKMDSPPSRP